MRGIIKLKSDRSEAHKNKRANTKEIVALRFKRMKSVERVIVCHCKSWCRRYCCRCCKKAGTPHTRIGRPNCLCCCKQSMDEPPPKALSANSLLLSLSQLQLELFAKQSEPVITYAFSDHVRQLGSARQWDQPISSSFLVLHFRYRPQTTQSLVLFVSLRNWG